MKRVKLGGWVIGIKTQANLDTFGPNLVRRISTFIEVVVLRETVQTTDMSDS